MGSPCKRQIDGLGGAHALTSKVGIVRRSALHYGGDTSIDGVPGSAAPIAINFLDMAGSVCASLLPTGQVRDRLAVDGAFIDVACIDNGMPMAAWQGAAA